ncbi:MAG: hypothetical protein AAFN13_07965 [Bacteroidota bacterium]
MEALLFLILAEATHARIRDLDLRIILQRGLTDGQRAVLQGTWQQAVATLTSPTSAHAAVASQTESAVTVRAPVLFIEGGTAPVVFTNTLNLPGASPRSGAGHRSDTPLAVTIDVGEAISDLTVRYEGDIVYGSTIRLAWRIIAQHLIRKPRLQKLLFSPEAAAALDEARSDERLFRTGLNMVLLREQAEISDRLARHAPDPDVIRLRQIIALKFGALAFHTGTILGAAAKHGIAPDLADQLREGGISVHWGGNGSQLASWLDFGNYETNGIAAQLLNNLLYVSLSDAGATPDVQILPQAKSPTIKYEVIGTPAVYTGRRYGDRSAEHLRSGSGVISGETISLSIGEWVDFLDPITLGDLFEGDQTLFQKSSVQRLKRFVDLFNKLGVKLDLLDADSRIPDDDATMLSIAQRAREHYVQMQDRKESDRVVEPVFIVEVRTLIRRHGDG